MIESNRVIFIDYLRLIACFLVILTHSNEPVYLGGMGTCVASSSDAFWSTFFVSISRSCVPLFVLASSYLLFPIKPEPLSVFFKKRVVKVGIPAVIWLLLYSFFGGGEPSVNLARLPFNFPAPAAHLWFCYMIMGLYLLMPLLSPWAQKVSKKELLCWIGLWFLTTFIPVARQAAMYLGDGMENLSSWGIWGEANWSEFGTFYYISGFIGYLLIGLYFRRYVGEMSWKKTLLIAIPLFCAGFALAASWFYAAMPKSFPFDLPLRRAVIMEIFERNCTPSVAAMTVAVFLCIRKINRPSKFYEHIVLPVSKASYGIYLMHIFALIPLYAYWRGIFGNDCFWDTPIVVFCTALSTYLICAIVSVIVRRIPVVGKYIVG